MTGPQDRAGLVRVMADAMWRSSENDARNILAAIEAAGGRVEA